MRSLFLSAALLAALGFAALTPGEASAFGRAYYYGSGYYPAYSSYYSGYYALAIRRSACPA